MFDTRKILLLEDEYSVISKFVSVCSEINSKSLSEGKGILVSLILDSSGSIAMDYSMFDAIFIDRDNSMSDELRFHSHFLRNFKRSSGNLKDLALRCFPMSGSALNNGYLTNEIIKVLSDKKPDESKDEYYLNDRGEASVVVDALNANTLTKSFPDFEKSMTEHIKTSVGINDDIKTVKNLKPNLSSGLI